MEFIYRTLHDKADDTSDVLAELCMFMFEVLICYQKMFWERGRAGRSGVNEQHWFLHFFRSLASGWCLWTRWIHKKKCSHLKMLKYGATAFQGFRVCGRDCSCSIRESARIFWSVTSALQRECREGIFRRLNEDLAVMVGYILLSSTKPALSWKHTLRNPFCSCLCIMRLRSFR